MDPDANISEQLRLTERFAAGSLSIDDANRLAELVEALDEWITRGGALPKRWRRRGVR